MRIFWLLVAVQLSFGVYAMCKNAHNTAQHVTTAHAAQLAQID